ncbi:hypothetical protein DS884_16355 [Tenacibaculum sp. E3R01]|uniref:hypothetical protein n=1 Tax=Tenacibaculum sp. E3R01 TaxID=2267227 RepID=UPI000DE9ADED|nr:hypothetical protein [Tenacibaculum sp. E3R01]RBW55201.1 hypothetical protein DS884_16355 [Tenacibaculum sp. E3R01]
MKTLLKYFFIVLTPYFLFSQNEIPTKTINVTYHLLEAERGIGNKPTKTKIFQYGTFGKDKVLAIAACKKCIAAIYKYKEKESKELGSPFFYSDIGLFMITYDNESFVMVMPSNKENADWTDFSFSNFYSKSKAKVNMMTQQKIKKFIIKISE